MNNLPCEIDCSSPPLKLFPSTESRHFSPPLVTLLSPPETRGEMKKPEEADVNELGEIYCEPINSVSVMEMIEIANGSIEAIQTDVQEESKTSDPDETISLSPENQRAGVKPSGRAQFLSIKVQSESTGQ